MTENPILETADKFYKTEADAEPIVPTEEAEVAEVQDPPKDEALETPEDGISEESEALDDEETIQYLELDGEEYNLEEVKKWKNGHLMQSDYTKKTTAHAEEVKAFEAERATEREELLKLKSEASDMRDQLSVLVAEDDEIDWVELKENDPEEYIERKEKADKRRELLDKVKAERQAPPDDPAFVQAEQAKLYAANPDWLDDEGKTTEAFKADTKLINDYSIKSGFTPDEFSKLSAHHITTILKAAKYEALQEKSKEIKGKREKVPLVTKPKAAKTSEQAGTMADRFYGKAG